jgi:hypothetical protein
MIGSRGRKTFNLGTLAQSVSQKPILVSQKFLVLRNRFGNRLAWDYPGLPRQSFRLSKYDQKMYKLFIVRPLFEDNFYAFLPWYFQE